MTSNLGSDRIQELSGEADYEQLKQAVMAVVDQHFRPEFINRIDESVVFHSLGREDIREIAGLQLELLNKRLQEREIELQVSDDLLDLIMEAGYDPVYGARPLKRAIQQYLENPLAEAILTGDFGAGDHIAGSVADGKACFTKA